ncbi:STAS domain-containing protein [Microbacterium dauci]|uniref:Anti-sigma factor antagonist n=1 Tax=Microbacterium dauci TaxID=3048008 RepID=A0ABT6ZC78_9MICO|nr:STAS domain-containing protein [Microbacterium sp. LX3-4]MDJ1113548.1 STAS domain-containing protein [Microbacterium sp. LX3-4]
MQLAFDTRPGGEVVTPQGRLTMVSARAFREQVSAHIQANTGSVIVIDLSEVSFIDSSGLGALVACLKTARQAGGDLRLAAPSEQVSMILTMTNLDRVLKPRPTVEESFGD